MCFWGMGDGLQWLTKVKLGKKAMVFFVGSGFLLAIMKYTWMRCSC